MKLNFIQKTRRKFILSVSGFVVLACSSNEADVRDSTDLNSSEENVVKFDAFDERFYEVIDKTQAGKILSTGHKWLEGPAWDRRRNQLYFTDVPVNKAYLWSETKGVSIFQDPSGVDIADIKGFREPGANGLFYADEDTLILCNHGRRSIELMDLKTFERQLLVDQFENKKFNSPNDIVKYKTGEIYFTDPPYGLVGLNASPLKEMEVNGVYKLSELGELSRIVDNMTFPNGIAISPDGTWLYVSQSDPERPIIRRINRLAPSENIVWFDAMPYLKDGPGLPDGMAVTKSGYVFCSGPTGIYILNPDGDVLGRINTGRACSNCTFGEGDGKTLFITAQDRLLKIRTRLKGLYN